MYKRQAKQGGISNAEMLKTFNCGIGMVIVVDRQSSHAVAEALASQGETVVKLGEVTDVPGVVYDGSLL